MDIPLVMLQIM